MRGQRKPQAQVPVPSPKRRVSPMRHGQRRPAPKAQQPAAIRQDRRCGDRRAQTRRPSAPDHRSAKLGRKPPRFPLTLRAMFGSRHQGHAWNRSVFSLLSVLALLAFACLPVAANADSSGVEYGTETPNAYGNHSTPTVVGGGGDQGGKAHSSSEPGGAGGGGGSGSGGSSNGDAGTGAGGGAGGVKAGNGSTNPQHVNGGKSALGEADTLEAVPASSQTSEDGGGSSPVVPILIVLVLLAAVSAGIVIMRQRRQQDSSAADSSAAPKAG
jgi:hypothetical protein